jgi:biopolymer transport protein ExbB/TolQ
MKAFFEREFFFQLTALILAFILVHALYVALVRPNAQIALAEEAALIEQNLSTEEVQRSVWVVIKDYEQESCFILALWAIAIMGYKARRAVRERQLLSQDLVQIADGTKILPEDARKLSRSVEALPENASSFLLPRALKTGLQRLDSGSSVQEVASSIRDVCETESERLDSELAMIRYIAWAIPSIGFIGTVRGIGSALANAHEAVAGNIAGVTASLGVAFNSTFIALLISILIMFLSHQLTLMQERLVLDSQNYCDRNLLRHLRV